MALHEKTEGNQKGRALSHLFAARLRRPAPLTQPVPPLATSLFAPAQMAGAYFLKSVAKRKYEVWRLRHRIEDSIQSISMWQQKWIIVSSITEVNDLRKTTSYSKLIAEPSAEDHNLEMKASSRRLLEALPIRSNKGAFWYSQGAFRLLLVRRVMDLVYASVGTSLSYTGPSGAYGLWMPLAGLCASYYAVAGSDVTSSDAARYVQAPDMGFIKRAWGMVTLPPIKWLSLEASRLLKGIELVERVVIGGTPCLLMSHSPQPVISAAIDRTRRQKSRNDLPEIAEEQGSEGINVDLKGIEEKDVIFHITGGGWFIHTTATDIPWLAEWSAVANAVVVVPEYDLLPSHHFPVALNQVTDMYVALASGEAARELGFRPRRIAVSGESAGGNLAAALIVKLCMDGIIDAEGVRVAREKTRKEVRTNFARDRASSSPPPLLSSPPILTPTQ